MIKEKNIKLLSANYDYYSAVKTKSDNVACQIYKQNDEIFKSRFYNLVLNICNQMLYDYTYEFTKEDLFFIAEHNINIHEIITDFTEDIKIMLEKENKNADS